MLTTMSYWSDKKQILQKIFPAPGPSLWRLTFVTSPVQSLWTANTLVKLGNKLEGKKEVSWMFHTLSCPVCNIFIFLSGCRFIYAVVTGLTGPGVGTWAEAYCCKLVLCNPKYCWRQKQEFWCTTAKAVPLLLLCYRGCVVGLKTKWSCVFHLSWLYFAELLFHMISFLSALSEYCSSLSLVIAVIETTYEIPTSSLETGDCISVISRRPLCIVQKHGLT